ncbi:hypothetical protein XELAEV_18034251mg [Xenopus laevis]|uniref:Actin filament-associated protein 1-like 2 n=1 Tax=Xenopus laevis TaxID=8355 RepID=A0A974CDJ9_XENLA|nr:hypothetical protein XELAEV_18034251mg [Xenopus laevis]
MERYKGLERLLSELEEFLFILDKENLSSAAVLKKSIVSEILQLFIKSNSSCDEEYIYMNKVLETDKKEAQGKQGKAQVLDPPAKETLTNGTAGQHLAPPQKSLPDLPPPKIITEKLPVSKCDSPEGYYEEAEPYNASFNDDGEAVSSSYESYDEDESNKSKSAMQQHQWPSTEASIELMKDAMICAFLWRKKWLGQWAKQLCVVKDSRLMCYKTSKDHNPQLDVNLIGCSVSYKEKQVRRKEHKLKITPNNTDVIVLGMQSKEQAEQWLKVIQDISGLQSDPLCDSSVITVDGQRQIHPKAEGTDRHSGASESGSSTDGHPETPEVKEVKKKVTSGLKLSNLMNLGRKKSTSMESPDKALETSNYLNVLINSQWKSRYCCIKDGQLHFYQDRNKTKNAAQPVSLIGCDIIPQPTQDHLYSFRILQNGEELATLEAKSSEDMGHWLGLLLLESGSRSDPEDFTYDYVDADRVSCIVSAAKNSYFLMQRKYCEPNTYIDAPRGQRYQQDDLYDDVDMSDIQVIEDPPQQTSPGTPIIGPSVSASPRLEKSNKERVKATNHVAIETLLGKNRTEAEIKRFTEEKEKLEKEREEIRVQLAQLRKERREMKETVTNCPDKGLLTDLEDKLRLKEEQCKEKESYRVDLELKLVEVKENLRKAELGPATLGTSVEPAHLDTTAPSIKSCSPTHAPECSPVTATVGSPVNSAVALKSRPQPIVTTGKVLQKAKEWEKKGAS